MKGRLIPLLRESLSGLRDLFFTRTCAVCGCVLDSDEVSRHDMPGDTHVMPGLTGHLLCEHCLGDIPLTYFWNYSENAAMERLFGCRTHNAAALFFYRHGSPYCEIVRQFKYGRRESLGLWAARLLGDYLAGRDAASGEASCDLYGDVQAVVPVPLHWFKQWQRGFNQAEIIARGVAERLGTRNSGLYDITSTENSDSVGTTFTTDTQRLPVVPHLLRRVKYTSTQTRRNATSRHKNVSGVFAVNPRELKRLKAAGIRHILLVDDVMTTGATLSECVRLLQDHFTVSVATLGFVE